MRYSRRRIRRFVRRFTRRLFRPKRRYRYSSRRRIKRTRRYYRRKSARKFRYKRVSSKAIAPGYLKRTYYFTFDPRIQLLRNDGTYSGDSVYIPYNGLRWNRISWAEVNRELGGYSHLWTGAGNVTGVYDIPEYDSRVFGFNCYTLIRLDWIGILRLMAISDFENQSRCIRDDCARFAYYKPISVSVKLTPKYKSLNGAYYTSYPTSITIPKLTSQSEEAGVTIPGWYGVLVNGTTIRLNSANEMVASGTANYTNYSGIRYDEGQVPRIAYILPANGDTLANTYETGTGESNTNVTDISQKLQGMFAALGRLPSGAFFSGLKRSKYKRAIYRAGKPINFTYYNTRNFNQCSSMYVAAAALANINNVNYFNDLYHLYNNSNGNLGPYNNLIAVEPNGWIRANLQTWGLPKVQNSPGETYPPNDEHRHPIVVHTFQYLPIDFATVILPGVDPANLLDRYMITFKYKVVYRGETMDLE